MKKSRTIASLALSAILTLGSVGVAEAAGHGHKSGHKSGQAAHGPKGPKTVKGPKATKADKHAKRLEAQRRVVVHDIVVKDARLAKALAGDETLAVPADVLIALGTSRDADRAGLAGLRDAAMAAATMEELAEVRAAVRAVRPEVYAVAVSSVLEAMALEAELVALEAGIDPLTADSAVLDLISAAHAAIAAVPGAAVLASGLLGHDSVDAVQAALEAAVLAVAEVTAALAPVVEEPVV